MAASVVDFPLPVGPVMKMTAKKTEDDLDADATIGTLTGTITDAAGGIGTISMASTDTNVSPGDYVYDVQVYNSSNSNLFTVVKDHLTIVADVTRAE